MSKITINNLSNSGIDVQNLIDKLIQVKSMPIDALKNTNELYKSRISKLNEMLDLLKKLQESSKSLFDYRSPFDEMLGISSNEEFFTVKANRGADVSTRKIQILQTAKNYTISSDTLPVGTKIGKVNFTIQVGDSVRKVAFEGGTIEEFVKAIKEQAGDIVNINITYKDKDNLVISIEAKKQGANGNIQFSEEVQPILEQLGIVQKVSKSESLLYKSDPFTLSKDTSNKINVPQPGVNEKLTITFDVQKKEFIPPSSQNINVPDEIGGGTPITIDPQTAYPDPVIANQLIDQSQIAKEPLTIKVIGTEGEKIIQIESSASGITLNKDELGIGNIQSIEFINKSSDSYTVSNLQVKSIQEQEGYVAKNIVQKGRNSIFLIDGIRIEKESNVIDDVIKGVTLTLKRETKEEETISIEPNTEYAKEKIIEWVGHYNNVIDFIVNETKINKEGGENGAFAGDTAFMMLHNSLQRIMQSSFSDRTYKMLAQIGISTGKPGSNPTTRGGYLEIDEEMLDKALKENHQKVKELFGFDSDGDRLTDNGIAFRIGEYLKGMTNFSDGTIKKRADYFAELIKQNDKRVETLNRQLETYRDSLIFKFASMENLISKLKGDGNYLSTYLNNSNSSNQNK